jgi:hypothetical protein
MRQEHVTLQDVDISQLYDEMKKYLKDLKLDIIHEEKEENYWDLKAHKGSLSSVIIGNVRDVEVMISGKEGNYDLILRTGACWGKDIAVSSYRAHTFEKNFWDHIKKTLSDMGSGKATTSQPVVVTH